MLETLFLMLHILTGASALMLGVAAMGVKKKQGLHTKIGRLYHHLFVLITVTALLLAMLNWSRLWWFAPIAIFSYAFALLGFLAAKFKWKNWLRFHLVGQGGSFIAMCTAVMVVNFGSASLLAWIVPTIIGAPILIWFGKEMKAGRRPRYH